MESKIISLCVMNSDGDVAVGLEPFRVPYADAQKLRLGDAVFLDPGGFVPAFDVKPDPFGMHGQGALPSPSIQQAYATIPPVRPDVPAFQPATDHEIGVAYCKGFTYQYAYPAGAGPADACRWSHIDETEVREELWDIKPGDIVYDIGSAFGSYALTALAMGAEHVVCFNPNPQEQDLLMVSARLNGWGDKIKRYNVGLWSETGYLNDEEQTFTKTGDGFKVTKTADGRHTQLFEVRTLDSMGFAPIVMPPMGRRVAKMDVEGAEAEVLKGARMFFAEFEPAFVLIEVHVFKDASLEQQTDAAMADLGYVPVTKRPYHSVMHALYRMKGWDD